METVLRRIVASRALADLLQAVGHSQVTFENVDPAAQSFLAYLIARHHKGRCWFICPDVRSQETFAAELVQWLPQAQIFPDLGAIGNKIIEDQESTALILPDAETESERLALLQKLASQEKYPRVVIHADQWTQNVPTAQGLQKQTLTLKKGMTLDPLALSEQLSQAGYEKAPQIYTRGQFALRGGILDIFSWQHESPVRLEFFGDELESLRIFDIDSQTTIHRLRESAIFMGEPYAQMTALSSYYREGDLLIAIDCDFEPFSARILSGSAHEQPDYSTAFYPTGLSGLGVGDIVLDEALRVRFFRQIQKWIDEDWAILIFCNNEGEAERLNQIIKENEIDPKKLIFQIGTLTRGFLFPSGKVAVLSDAEIFGRSASLRARNSILRRKQAQVRRQAMDFSQFEEGDLVVHFEHGIARYMGMRTLPQGSMEGSLPLDWDEETSLDDKAQQTVLVLEFANEARLFVPLKEAWQISRYVGLGQRAPALSELGSNKWARMRNSTEHAIFAYANRLLKLQAERLTETGHAFPPDSEWQQEFENAFFFKPTHDQIQSLVEIKADMESPRPMDRLLCGDVGFGKTEVAVRAVFKAVMGGKQAAILAPTTVLAQQHYQTFRERMSDYPISIDLLSRYRSPAEQRKTLARLKSGEADIVIGTHRLISPDVEFKDLGIVVVDEEQRFGVAHKDRLKERFRKVDVLTLSATPIPRTLYMALTGVRDMSSIETPPPNRHPVETVVCAYDERIIRDAITREIARGGQVYFLHNRVKTIERVRSRILALCPGAKVDIGHGQMAEGELEEVMKRFMDGKTDVLVSTTIIESGLDIPNANTILIDRSDRFGLADLYQLRGRVGRAGHKAYAYLLLPRKSMMESDARRRVMAIRQYTELGSGFKIAMRDLEIRGAGNILGTAQSGHIIAVGFDLYCRMLKEAVQRSGGDIPQSVVRASLDLDFVETEESRFEIENAKKENSLNKLLPAFLPSSYILTARLRMEAYRKIAEAGTIAELKDLEHEWRDRYGPLPEAALHFLLLHRIMLVAGSKQISQVATKDTKLLLTRKGDYVLMGKRFPRLTKKDELSKLREVLHYVEQF